jgi:acyl carrier protein
LYDVEHIIKDIESKKQYFVRSGVAKEYVAPRTPTEEALATIWKKILKINQIGIYDNFFDLGGHSLLAVISRVRDLFNVELSMVSFFDTLTVAGISKAIEKSKIEQSELGEILEVLNELDSLSDNEINMLFVEVGGIS